MSGRDRTSTYSKQQRQGSSAADPGSPSWQDDRLVESQVFSDHHRLFVNEMVDVDYLLDSLARLVIQKLYSNLAGLMILLPVSALCSRALIVTDR